MDAGATITVGDAVAAAICSVDAVGSSPSQPVAASAVAAMASTARRSAPNNNLIGPSA